MRKPTGHSLNPVATGHGQDSFIVTNLVFQAVDELLSTLPRSRSLVYYYILVFCN